MNVPARLSTHDYLVRLPGSQLCCIVLEHLLTEQDPLVLEMTQEPDLRRPGRRAGLTEWEGSVSSCYVSLAWDWVELDDGEIQLLPDLPVRSNVMPLDGLGYDLSRDAADRVLLELIESLPWRSEVVAALAEQAALA
jgi:hypothetical protein